MSGFLDEGTERCPDCGARVEKRILEAHQEVCDGERQEFDGECSMCGKTYDSFLTHLAECEARDSRETTVASTNDETDWHSEPVNDF